MQWNKLQALSTFVHLWWCVRPKLQHLNDNQFAEESILRVSIMSCNNDSNLLPPTLTVHSMFTWR